MKVIQHNPKDYMIIFFSLIVSSIIAWAGSNGLEYFDQPILNICMYISFIVHWLVFIPSYFLRTEKLYDITGTITFIILVLCTFFIFRQQDPGGLRSSDCHPDFRGRIE